MKKVLFVSATVYSTPLSKDISKKFEVLSEICLPIVFAFGNKNEIIDWKNSKFYLNKKNKNRFLNYIHIAFLFFFRVPKLIKSESIEVVCFQDPITSFITIVSLKLRKINVKIITESHGDFIETIILEKNLLFPKSYRYIFEKVAKISFQNSDIIRTISEFTENQINKFNLNKQYVRFPAWIDVNKYISTSREISNEESFKILFAGTISPRKNPQILVEAIDYLDENIVLEIIGKPINNEYFEQLKKRIENSKHKKNILITPHLSQDELIKKYLQYDLFILPSISEGLGRVVIEAQATGCPVLVSSDTGIVDLVMDGETGFIFENNNVLDLSSKLDTLIKDRELLFQVGLNSREFVKNNFNENNFKFGYKKLFDLV